jgi:FkbM family methyltransferase
LSGQEWDLFAQGQKEPTTIGVFQSLLTPGMTVLDVGANIGYYSLVAAVRVGPSGQVIAYEPTPFVVKRLQENVNLNQFRQISVVEGAISDRVGTGTFYLNSNQESSEGNSLIEAAVSSGSVQITCPQTTLDAEMTRLNLKQVDVLKIDVEGNEVKVLRGARQLLTTFAPQILLEVNPHTLEAGGSSSAELYQELEQNGYSWRIVEQMPWKGITVLNIHAVKSK